MWQEHAQEIKTLHLSTYTPCCLAHAPSSCRPSRPRPPPPPGQWPPSCCWTRASWHPWARRSSLWWVPMRVHEETFRKAKGPAWKAPHGRPFDVGCEQALLVVFRNITHKAFTPNTKGPFMRACWDMVAAGSGLPAAQFRASHLHQNGITVSTCPRADSLHLFFTCTPLCCTGHEDHGGAA